MPVSAPSIWHERMSVMPQSCKAPRAAGCLRPGQAGAGAKWVCLAVFLFGRAALDVLYIKYFYISFYKSLAAPLPKKHLIWMVAIQYTPDGAE